MCDHDDKWLNVGIDGIGGIPEGLISAKKLALYVITYCIVFVILVALRVPDWVTIVEIVVGFVLGMFLIHRNWS